MTVKLTKKDLDDMSGSASDVEARAKEASKIIADNPKPSMAGFTTADAIGEVSSHWTLKADRCAGRWQYFSGALADTGTHITKTDEEIAFYFPKAYPGIKD
ncbi:MAG TPA: hypothetical protein VE172_17970 [Stackebrandtia sp.]|jgi:hypothetical protein|uniref:hypothetical protein n=1 Tax=Stackebrandtia sp. TaxID=2023065 RepID=UPI002D648FE3|nr:hypothetical protein [Stackebrandtia sp.]HZE40693.1 hypothetical protein [Stackebrandtia sp.]